MRAVEHTGALRFPGGDERDSPEQFFEDMVRGGRFIGDQNIVEIVAFTVCDRILDMERYGVRFKKCDDGKLYQTPMPVQAYPRSCFMFEDEERVGGNGAGVPFFPVP